MERSECGRDLRPEAAQCHKRVLVKAKQEAHEMALREVDNVFFSISACLWQW